MRLPNGVERSRPTIAWQRDAGLAHRVPISPTSLPSSVCSSSRPRRSPPRGRRACARRSRARRGRTARPARASRRAGPQPAAEPARRAGHRHAARIAREPPRRARRAAPPAARPAPGRRPSAAEDRGARSNGVRTSHSTTIRAPRGRRAPRSPPARPPAVGRRRAAHADQHDLAPASTRRDQLAGPVGGRGPGSRSSSATRPSPDAAAISTTAVPPSSTSPNEARTGRPSGSWTSRRSPRRRARAAAPPSSLAAVGQRAEVRAASVRRAPGPRPIAATSAARNVPLNESGATRTGRSGMRASQHRGIWPRAGARSQRLRRLLRRDAHVPTFAEP